MGVQTLLSGQSVTAFRASLGLGPTLEAVTPSLGARILSRPSALLLVPTIPLAGTQPPPKILPSSLGAEPTENLQIIMSLLFVCLIFNKHKRIWEIHNFPLKLKYAMDIMSYFLTLKHILLFLYISNSFGWKVVGIDWIVFTQNSYLEARTPHVTVFGDRAFRR